MDPSGPDVEQLSTLTERSRGAVGELRDGLAAAAERRRDVLARLGDEAAELVSQISERVATELAEDFERRGEESQAHLAAQIAAAEAQRTEWQAERDAWQAERDAWQSERTEWEAVRDEVERELGAREKALAEGVEGASVAKVAGLEAALTEAEATRDQLAETLEGVADQLTAAQQSEQELADLREKFDIALADLQSHRDHVASLEEQLAARPAADGDSAELTQLRQQRDQLAAELEAALASPPTPEPGEEVRDLRERFELAVEEVRELKTENADLKERLATTPESAVVDENDWEAQKRRLLAELEGESPGDDPQRAEERATIAGTIQITDEVIAEKEREIARLREALQGDRESAEGDATAAAFDADEVIRAERQRLADLESEWQEKLRAAELELSVERAKIARAQSELEEQQIELETLRASVAAQAGEPLPDGEAKRKWLSKLGLGGEGGGN